MFDIPPHERAPLIATLKGKSGGTLIISAKGNEGTRLIFPNELELYSVGVDHLGDTPVGYTRFQRVRNRSGTAIELSVRGKPEPEAIERFLKVLGVYRSITPSGFDLLSWFSDGKSCSRYLDGSDKWRIGTTNVGKWHIYPDIERIREMCASVISPNVLIKLVRQDEGRPKNLSNHVMLTFADPQSALDIDRIAYLITSEAIEWTDTL